LATKISRELRERLVKTFLDLIIMSRLKKQPLGGYDIINLIHKELGILLSPGSVYSILYAMERKGLITGASEQRKRVYALTGNGRKTIEKIVNNKEEIAEYLISLL